MDQELFEICKSIRFLYYFPTKVLKKQEAYSSILRIEKETPKGLIAICTKVPKIKKYQTLSVFF